MVRLGILRELFFPRPTCAVCGGPADADGLCQKCRLLPYRLPRCQNCGNLLADLHSLCPYCSRGIRFSYRKAVGLYPYENRLRKNIWRLKYYNRTSLARPFGLLLSEAVPNLFAGVYFDLLLPVPISAARLQRRGYNHCELLTNVMAAETGLVYQPYALRKVRDTPPLKDQSRDNRFRLLRDAFVAEPELVRQKTILLVDDIFTSGATADSASRTLRLAGAKAVYVLTLATTLQKYE